MKTFLAKATLLLLFSFVSSPLLASDVFTDKDSWRDSVCGEIVSTDFEALIDNSGNPLAGSFFGPIPNDQVLGWGTLSQQGNAPSAITAFASGGNRGGLSDETRSLDFDLDPTQDPIEGFCFKYIGNSFQVSFFDGATLVETQSVDVDGTITLADDPAHFGWTNTDSLNVTRIEVIATDTTPDAAEIVFVLDGEFSFGGSCNVDPTPQELLEQVITNLTAIGPTGDCKDDNRISTALYYLNCAADPAYFDENGLLNENGCSYFWNMKKASKLLNRVEGNAEVDQALMDIQALLTDVVENELAAAIASGGNPCDIETAENRQLAADAFAAAGNFKKATQKRKEAWAYAYCSY